MTWTSYKAVAGNWLITSNDTAWTTPENAYTENAVYASWSVGKTAQTSNVHGWHDGQGLDLQQDGFTYGDTVNGIELAIKGYDDNPDCYPVMRQYRDNFNGWQTHTKGTARLLDLPASNGWVYIGGATDKLGFTDDGRIDAQAFMDGGFGAAIYSDGAVASRSYYIDQIKYRVEFTKETFTGPISFVGAEWTYVYAGASSSGQVGISLGEIPWQAGDVAIMVSVTSGSGLTWGGGSSGNVVFDRQQVYDSTKRYGIAYRVLQAGDTFVNMPYSSPSSPYQTGSYISVWRGVSPSAPIHQYAFDDTPVGAVTSERTFPQVTTTKNGCMILCGTVDEARTSTGSYTYGYGTSTYRGSCFSYGEEIEMASVAQTSAGAITPSNWTGHTTLTTYQAGASFTLALAPKGIDGINSVNAGSISAWNGKSFANISEVNTVEA